MIWWVSRLEGKTDTDHLRSSRVKQWNGIYLLMFVYWILPCYTHHSGPIIHHFQVNNACINLWWTFSLSLTPAGIHFNSCQLALGFCKYNLDQSFLWGGNHAEWIMLSWKACMDMALGEIKSTKPAVFPLSIFTQHLTKWVFLNKHKSGLKLDNTFLKYTSLKSCFFQLKVGTDWLQTLQLNISFRQHNGRSRSKR